MKNDFVMPVVVLVLICVVISGALAATNSVTGPVIVKGATERAEAARIEILPEADGFERISPQREIYGVTECYRATNGAGFVISVSGDGYGGNGSLSLMVAVSPEGAIIATKTLANSDTKGIGSKVSEPLYESQFAGMDSSLGGYIAITGATVSSNAYRSAVENALAAYAAIAGQEGENE